MRFDVRTAGHAIRNINFLSNELALVMSKVNLPMFSLYSCLLTYCIYGSGNFYHVRSTHFTKIE